MHVPCTQGTFWVPSLIDDNTNNNNDDDGINGNNRRIKINPNEFDVGFCDLELFAWEVQQTSYPILHVSLIDVSQ